MKLISAMELDQWMRASAASGDTAPQILDVREPNETAICRLPSSTLIPMREVPARLATLNTDRPIVCVCHHGARSMQVAMFLDQNGLTDVYNLTGGVAAWSRDVDHEFPTY